MIKKDLFLAEIVDLAQTIGISITIHSLQQKLEECSSQKDALFSVKASKMQEISHQIQQLDEKI